VCHFGDMYFDPRLPNTIATGLLITHLRDRSGTYLLVPQSQFKPLTISPSKLNSDLTLKRAQV
jgi:hypothetical protein